MKSVNYTVIADGVSPVGPCRVALSGTRIAALQFGEEAEGPRPMEAHPGEAESRRLINDIFTPESWNEQFPFPLTVSGTPFQLQVWRALLHIPRGAVWTYEDVCARLGRPPTHARAVAQAIGANPVGFLIPCHRVVCKSGDLGGYRWGQDIKAALLAWEQRG